MNTSLKDKVRGSLFGFAIGDAMGATTEFMSAKSIKLKYGVVDQIIGGGWLNLKAGKVTDDTQMMLCVARAMMEHWGNTDAIIQQIGENFVAWLESGPIDVGTTCMRSIYANRGKPWKEWISCNQKHQCDAYREDLGNGGLMRCLVPCLLGDRYTAWQQSNLTHSNTTCCSAIDIYYWAVNDYLRDRPVPIYRHVEPKGHVEYTLSNAIYWAQKDSFRKAILGAVNDGGDADTIAALSGGLAGARYGYTAIPSEWLSVLEEDTTAELEKIADFICTHI